MRILHLIDSGGFYGAEAVLIELVGEQRKQGLDARIGSIGNADNEKPIEVAARAKNLPVHIFKMSAGLNFIGILKLLAFAKKEKFDVIHSHGYKANILLGLMPQFIRQIPFIITLHGWTSVKALTKMWVYEKMDAYLLKNRKFIVLVSRASAQHASLQKVKKNCVVIENGISSDLPPISKGVEMKKILALKEKGIKIIGSIGRLSYEKGYDLLIKAVAQCEQEMVLVLMGDGPEKNELQSIAKQYGIEKKVLFFGYVEQAGQYIPLFDVYVNSSRTEGAPITLLEAMRAKTPIVARDVGGNKQLLGNGGYGVVVQGDSPTEMIKSITESMEKNDTRVRQAYESFVKNYSVSAMTKKYINVYYRLLGVSE